MKNLFIWLEIKKKLSFYKNVSGCFLEKYYMQVPDVKRDDIAYLSEIPGLLLSFITSCLYIIPPGIILFTFFRNEITG